MTKKDIIIFSAPSGSGKTTILKRLFELNPSILDFSISATSRPKRKEEIEGKDYYFLSKQDFQTRQANGEFLESEEVYDGIWYGTLRSEIDRVVANGKIIAFDVDVKGGINIKKQFKERAVSIFIQPPSIEELRRRLERRGTESKASIDSRIERAAMELAKSAEFDQVILNDNINDAVDEAQTIIERILQL